MYIYDFIQGLIIGSTLIIAIGPQNLFVINQGLKKSFVFMIVLFCSLSDSILIIIGINLSSFIIDINPNTIVILKILGGIWLLFYGLNKINVDQPVYAYDWWYPADRPFFSEKPFGQLFPGALLIILAGLVIIWRENKLKA